MNRDCTSTDYRSTVTGVGDHRAIPVDGPAVFETQIPTSSYGLNHPKAYLAYAVALAQTESRQSADALVSNRVINAVDDARQGAVHLDLITSAQTNQPPSFREYQLTEYGRTVVAKITDAFENTENALSEFQRLKGSRSRFTETHDVWKAIGPDIAQADPAIAYLVDLLQDVHNDSGRDEFPLAELAQYYLCEHDPEFTVEFFFNDRQTVRDKIHATLQNNECDIFYSVDAYRATVTYQLKSMLFHLGVLSERGKDTSRFNPETDIWALSDRLRTS